ncbi:MAG: phosphatidylserine decarboxylase [Nitrososphaerota archaeon]|nr:phosphatidylserine decarboxylase [Nitrososphaerota archaeon]
MIIIALILTILGALAVVASVMFFYRDPERKIIQAKDAFLSPADGTIVSVRRYFEGEVPTLNKGSRRFKVEELAGVGLLGPEGTIISIHISPLDVHTIRSPTDGRVVHIAKIRGGLKFMRDPSFEVENERVSIVLETFAGKIGVIVVGAPIASSVKTLVSSGESVHAGQRIARIRLGSLASLVVHGESQMTAAMGCGAKVKAGLSVIARKIDSCDGTPVEECYGAIRANTLERVYLIFLAAFVAVKRLSSYVFHENRE